MVSWRQAGTFSSKIDLFTILLIIEILRWICSFSNHVPNVFQQQEQVDDFLTNLTIALQVAGLNVWSRSLAIIV